MILMNSFNLLNMVKYPTYGSNILDLILSNDHDYIYKIDHIINVKFSDHHLLSCHIDLNIKNSDEMCTNDIEYTTNIPKYDWVKGKDEKWSEYELFLDNLDWNLATKCMNIDKKLEHLYMTMENGIKHVFELKEEK